MLKIAYLLKTIVLVILFALTSTQSFAQVPTISSFSPQKGKYHDIDTIIGNGFHSNVDSNFVFFGKVRAKVISATLNKLIVEIPRSAQSGPITLTKGGLTTKSRSQFMVCKEGGSYIDSSVLSPVGFLGSVASNSLMEENQLACGDFNLDGEIDIVETDISSKSLIYLNNKTYQVPNTFSYYINLPDSTGSKILGTADMNNDGKMDIISVNKQLKKIYYFKNISTTTAFSLASPRIFSLQNSPRDFAVNDFNNDGKLDLAITYDTITSGAVGISILLNTSPNADTLLFSSPIAVAGNYSGVKILSTDFNLDGKQDLIVSPSISGQSQTIFLNNSSSNTTTFTPFSFYLAGGDKMHIGDLTLDGKPDIIIQRKGIIYIFENNITNFTGSMVSYDIIYLPYINSTTYDSKYIDINMDGFSDILAYNSVNGLTNIYLQDRVPDNLNKRTFSISTILSGFNTIASLVLVDLDTNYSQDMVSFKNGLLLTQNDFLKPQPIIKSSNVNLISLESFMVKCRVNKGNGNRRMVLLKKGSPITQLPRDYVDYFAKDSFELGSSLESDSYVMYMGNKDTFTFNNLRRNTRYYAAVVEFNGSGLGANFMDSAFYFDFQTKDQVSVQVSNVLVTQISDSSARISWTKGDGTNRLVLVNRSAHFSFDLAPKPFKKYKADNNLRYGDTVTDKNGYNGYVVYADTGSYCYLNELSVSTNYIIIVFEYEIKNDSIYYTKLITPAEARFNTLLKMPRIDSIVPLKARPGDKITIYGDNFDYDILMNKADYLSVEKYNRFISMAVTFGAVRSSQINVINRRIIEAIVPYGATNDFVRVTTESVGDSYSPKRFQPYFISKDTFGSGTYGLNTGGFGWGSVSDPLNGIGLCDVNQDGKLDFLFPQNNSIMYGIGHPNTETYAINSWIISFGTIFNSLTSYRTIETNFDYDNDLRPCVLGSSLDKTSISYYTPPLGFYGAGGGWGGLGPIYGAVLGLTDFNKDGKYDCLVINDNFNNDVTQHSIGISQPNGAFWSWPSGNQYLTASSIDDFNNDGKPDIISANYQTGKINIFRNLYDNGVFGKNSFDSTLTIIGPAGWEKLECGDIDEDGKEDFAITNSINNKLYIYKNVSTGNNLDSNSFAIAAVFSLPCKPNRVRLQDVSGDGKIDLIVSGYNTNGKGIVIYKNIATNKSIDTNSFILCSTPHNSNGGDLKLADINLDGKPEMVFNSYSASMFTMVKSSQKLFTINQLQKVAYFSGDTFRLSYNTYGRNFNAGNICKVQLLDSTGTLLVNANIGQKTSALSVDTLLCTLPVSLSYGSYKLRVVSTSGADTSTVSDFNIGVCQSGQVTNLLSSKGFSICGNDSTNLVAGTSTAGNFKWYKNNILVAVTDNNLLQIKSAGQYKVNYISKVGCLIPSNTLQVNTINNAFSDYTLKGNLVLCEGDSLIVTTNSIRPPNQTLWYLNNNLLQADSFSSITIKQPGTYNSIVVDSNLCRWITPTFNVSKDDYKVKISGNKSLTFCKGDSTLLIADSMGNGGLKWRWFINNILLPDTNNTLKMFSSGLVKLKAVNSNGCIKYSNDTQVVAYPLPKANFIINNAAQCLSGNKFSFVDSSNIASGALSRKWNFGMGSSDTSTLLNTSKSYSNAGIYVVKLISITSNGCNDSLTKNINVYPQPKVGFTINNSSQCLTNNNFVFIDTSANTTRVWNIENGNSPTTKIVNKAYTNTGIYEVKLVAKSANNCTDSITKTVKVNPQPVIGNITGNVSPTFGTQKFKYSVLSQANADYNWSVKNGTIQSGQGTNSINITWPAKAIGAIKAIITNSNGCSDSTNLAINIISVGINEVANSIFSNISFNPNPFTNNIEISFVSMTKETTKLVIINAIGKEVYSKNVQSNIGDNTIVIDEMAGLKPGIYFVHLENNNGFSQTVKLIKN